MNSLIGAKLVAGGAARLRRFLASLLLCLITSLLLSPGRASAANLTAAGIAVLDVTGSARNSFSNTEYVILRQQVRNDAASAKMIYFKFYILNPSGAVVFTHEGNAAPGTPGLSQTQLSGMNISRFYAIPGEYTFRGVATLDPEPAVTQEVKFAVSSPNITLIYPPLGARGLADTPLIFRWSASGASKYRLTVSDSASLYNPVHTAINSGGSSYAYPQNPTQPREKLAPGQVYYWKVEGLDAYNNKISDSNIYNFSMQAQGPKTRDVAVTQLEVQHPEKLDFTKQLEFKVTLTNLGSASESNINVKLTVGGMPADGSPKQVQNLDAGHHHQAPFKGYVPQDQNQSLVVACIDLFDDNIPNNCKTLLLSKPAAQPPETPKEYKKMTYDEMWDALKKRLGPDALKALEGYDLDSLTCPDCTGDELNSILAALLAGDATITGTSVTDTTPIVLQLGGGGGGGTDDQKQDTTGELGEGPEFDFDLGEQDDELPAEQLTTAEMWEILKKSLSPEDLKALEGYNLSSLVCPNCTGDELNNIFAALQSGDATITGVSIADAGGIVLQLGGAGGEQEQEMEEYALEPEPKKTSPDEWTGYTNAFNNDEVETYVIKSKDDWKKIWKILSNEKAPGLKFGAKMVIGIASGREDNADTVRILSQRPGEDGLKVDYYMIRAEEGKTMPFCAYIFKVVDKVDGKVEYKRLDVGK